MTINGIATIRNPALSPGLTETPPVAIGVATAYAAAGPLVAGTSNTTNSIDTVINKNFVINEYNRSFFPGTRLRATAVGYTNVWLEGIVVSWDGQTVTLHGDLASGGGTYSNWDINVAGQPGIQGQTGPVGPVGPSGGSTGPAGPPGPAGSVWRNGTGVPPNALGVDGDYYLDDATGNVYTRQASTHTYVVISNIQGPQGVVGPVGPQGPVGSVWRNGHGVPPNTLGVDGDYYLDDDTSNVWLRSGGTYGVVANIQGSAGPIGPPGSLGPPGNTGNTGPAGPTGPGYASSSTTSLAVALGSQTFATQAGLAWSAGARARTTSAGTPTAWMEGTVTAYSGTTLTINVDANNGTGTHADWNINVTGLQGATGPAGPSGAGTGNVLSVGTPTAGQLAQWTNSTSIQGIAATSLGFAPIASPTLTGNPQSVTPATADSSISIATTAFVKAQLYATLASPVFTGNPQSVTPATADNSVSIATTAFVQAKLAAAGYAPLASPAFTGTPTAPTVTPSTDSTTKIATTAFVAAAVAAFGTSHYTASPTPPISPAPMAGDWWYDLSTGILSLYVDDGNSKQWTQISPVPATSAVSQTVINQIIGEAGRLSYVSGTALQFVPYRGNQIRINGTWLTIPNAGIAGLANTGVFVNGVASQNLAANTVYWIFAFSNSGVVTADFRTAATHATSVTSGNEGQEILTGDDTRSLIGMCRTNASSQFQVDGQNIGVLSWFNRRKRVGLGFFSTNHTLVSTSAIELNSEIRTNFLSWAGEGVEVGLVGSAQSTAAGIATATWIYSIDQSAYVDGGAPSWNGFGNGGFNIGGGLSAWAPPEGWHTLTLYGLTSSGTSTYMGSAAPGPISTFYSRCAISVTLQG